MVTAVLAEQDSNPEGLADPEFCGTVGRRPTSKEVKEMTWGGGGAGGAGIFQRHMEGGTAGLWGWGGGSQARKAGRAVPQKGELGTLCIL
jgi:hypothetical protein